MLVYYMPDGVTEISKEKFLQFYSDLYYWRNSKYVEDEILKIFECKTLSEQNIIDILAWKSGKINHSLSTLNNKIEYYDNYWNKEKNEVNIYGKAINVSSVKYLFDTIEDDMVCSYVDAFKDGKSGIGPVYALTLRFFATGGKEPIYDSFSRKALWSIRKEIEGPRSDPSFNNIVKIYNVFLKMIKEEFENEYSNRECRPDIWRRVDQALWTYGHCFHVQQFIEKNRSK